MIGLTNAGGGGGGLRVVVGMTAPTNPKEGVVWVKSESAGKKYVLSKTEPQNPATGLIWIALSGDTVLTAKANVYDGSAWRSVSAYIYANGEWVQFSFSIAWLYNEGDKCTALTGGWASKGWAQSSNQYDHPKTPDVTYNAKNVDIHQYKYNDYNGGGSGIWYTNKTIDLTGFQTIEFHLVSGTINAANYTNVRMGAFDVSQTYLASPASYYWRDDGKSKTYNDETISVDISKLSSKLNIGIYLFSYSNHMYLTVDKICLKC